MPMLTPEDLIAVTLRERDHDAAKAKEDLRERMKSALTKVRADEPALAQLRELPGIGAGLSRRIVDFYGPTKALEVVAADPYKLIQDIDGIGFEKADKIALMGGLGTDSDQRVEAGVVYSIDQLGQEKGHCYVGRVDVTRAAVKLLGVDASLISSALTRLVSLNRAVLEEVDGEDAVYTWSTHYAEESVAEALARISSTAPRETQGNLTLFKTKRKSLEESATIAISQFAARSGYPLSASQQDAVLTASKSKVLVITGGPGTGKTTVLRAIVDSYRIACLTRELAAPTGRAAKRMSESTGASASTIHRLLGLRPGKRPKFDRMSPLTTDCLILDETSMVDLALMKKVLDAVAPASRLILIGDVDQLPSIGPGAVLRDVIDSGAVPVVRLSQVFRQAKGSRISVSAQEINSGVKPTSETGKGGEFYIFDSTQPRSAADTVVDLVTRKLPNSFNLNPVNDVQVLCPTKKGPDGVEELNLRIQAILNPPGGPEAFGFRVGDKVIHVDKNDYDKDVMNGDVGFVHAVTKCETHATKCKCILTVGYDDRKVEYDKDDICNLKLAYALTIHKSQGGEYKAVVIPMLGPDIMLSRNLLYTAVTRAKGVCVLVSNDMAIRRALSETKREMRNTRLAHRLARQAA